MADPRQLARIHRVREVQARLAQAEEARAGDRAAAEAALHGRIAGLAAGVAPRPERLAATALGAAAHYRDRLATSAAAAAARVRAADLHLERSRLATRDALRDRTATEKLLERARADEARARTRVAAEAPTARRDRHGPC